MKKIFTLILVSGIFINCFSQVTKEHAFEDQNSIDIQSVNLENSGQKLFVVNRIDSIRYQFVFYNSDFSEFSTISINLGSLFFIPGYNSPSFDVSFISESLFDTDTDIDILGQLTYYDNDNEEYAQVVVFNQNGSVLFASDIENSNSWLIYSSVANSRLNSSLTNTGSGAKLILDAYYFNEGTYSFDVYSLPGSVPSSIRDINHPQELSGNYLRAYPVPADEFIEMDFQLSDNQNSGTIEIVDENGKLIQKMNVDRNRGNIRMPVKQYKNGIYIYKLNTKRGMPRTGKIIILK